MLYCTALTVLYFPSQPCISASASASICICTCTRICIVSGSWGESLRARAFRRARTTVELTSQSDRDPAGGAISGQSGQARQRQGVEHTQTHRHTDTQTDTHTHTLSLSLSLSLLPHKFRNNHPLGLGPVPPWNVRRSFPNPPRSC